MEPHFGGAANRTAAIIGLGLIGGSIARDLAAAGVRVLGSDADPGTLDAAREAGVVEATGPGLERLSEADWVVLGVPVDAAPELLASLAPLVAGAELITDLGSTKRAVTAAAEALGLGDRFVGSHPFAGDHRSGWEASSRGLFRGAPVFLTPCPSSGDAALHAARALWDLCGATIQVLDATEHDRLLAWTSHLPQVASTALALALRKGGVGPEHLGRGGRDVTRLASASPDVWTGIALENADQLRPAVDALLDQLATLRGALDARSRETVRDFFSRGAEWAGPG